MKKELSEIKKILANLLPELREKYKIETLEIFGFYIRHTQDEKSDLDLLVTFQETPGLLQFLKLENYLSDTLNLQVDLVLKDSLKPVLSKQILTEATAI